MFLKAFYIKSYIPAIAILISNEHEFETAYLLYLEAIKSNKFNPFIVLFQHSNYHNQINDPNNSLVCKLKKHNIPYFEFINSIAHKDILQSQQCKLFITFSPYTDTYPKDLWELLLGKKIIYVPYGPLVCYVNYSNSFYDHCSIIFLDNEYVYENFCLLKGADWVKRCENIGFLGFQAWNIKRTNTILQTNFKLKVLITEHWTRLWDDPDPGSTKKTGYCKFEKYAEIYLKLPPLFPEICFTFRPHPYMFENLINTNAISRSFKDEFITNFTSFPNAIYDHASSDFNSIIFDFDALISSGISAWCQFAATNKPVLMLLENTEEEAGLNLYGENITRSHYRGYSDLDIVNFISEVIIKGSDPNKQIRDKIFESFIKSKCCASKLIIDCIENRGTIKNYLSIALDDDLTNHILKKYKIFHRVSPNTVTLLGLMLNFVIFYCIIEGLFFLSALLLIIRYLADCLDGGIARMYNKKSKFGGFLDTLSDNILLFLSVFAILLLYKVPFGLLISITITFANIVIMFSNNSLVDHSGIKADVKKSLSKSLYVFLVNNSFLLFIFKIIIIYLSRYFSFADFS